ncbi:hypothetical protein ACJMK2_023368 [Sinanodonta woodiana]|uniref:Transcription elongation factor Eaf N-terminal domain-containing protein n=1 Tax=Sinanodonta woodiana TaxID=1069815 RepID=A0ABD3T4X5_SINWO
MSDRSLVLDEKAHELKLGASFDPKSRVAFHSIRYDFKPASVDITKDALVEIGERNQATVTVPHVEGSGKTHTVYKGNKQPKDKECVLIIDHDTGTFTLERLCGHIQLKKTRDDGSSKSQHGGRPLTPVDHNRQKASPSKVKASRSPPAPVHIEPPAVMPKIEIDNSPIGMISDSSVSEDSDNNSSDSDSKPEIPQVKAVNTTSSTAATSAVPSQPRIFSLSKDLELSESSDSDSD